MLLASVVSMEDVPFASTCILCALMYVGMVCSFGFLSDTEEIQSVPKRRFWQCALPVSGIACIVVSCLLIGRCKSYSDRYCETHEIYYVVGDGSRTIRTHHCPRERGWFGGKVMEVRGDDGRVYTFPYAGVGIAKMERNTVDGSERVLPQEMNSYR